MSFCFVLSKFIFKPILRDSFFSFVRIYLMFSFVRRLKRYRRQRIRNVSRSPLMLTPRRFQSNSLKIPSNGRGERLVDRLCASPLFINLYKFVLNLSGDKYIYVTFCLNPSLLTSRQSVPKWTHLMMIITFVDFQL